jgi:type 1 glutamine amidotransferase
LLLRERLATILCGGTSRAGIEFEMGDRPMLLVKCAGQMFGFAAAIALFAFAALFTSKSASAADESSAAKPAKPARMLFVTKSFGFVHDVVKRKNGEPSIAEKEVKKWADESGLFTVDCTQDVPADFTKDNLKTYDLVMFYTTGDRAKFDYFLNDWAKQKGHGFIGVHSATDTLKDYKPYYEMIGGTFNEHPWTSNSHVTVVVNDTDHPISKPWGKEFEIKDEIYQFKNWQPEKVRVLMSLDIARSTFDKHVKDNVKQFHVPIAWCREYGDGKLFHMSLGHNEAVWKDSRYKESMLGGIKWILELEPGSAKPNPELEAPEIEKGKAAVAAKTAEFDAK